METNEHVDNGDFFVHKQWLTSCIRDADCIIQYASTKIINGMKSGISSGAFSQDGEHRSLARAQPKRDPPQWTLILAAESDYTLPIQAAPALSPRRVTLQTANDISPGTDRASRGSCFPHRGCKSLAPVRRSMRHMYEDPQQIFRALTRTRLLSGMHVHVHVNFASAQSDLLWDQRRQPVKLSAGHRLRVRTGAPAVGKQCGEHSDEDLI